MSNPVMMSNRYLTKLLLSSADVEAASHKECSFVHVRVGERAAAPEPLTTFVVHVLKQDIYELLHPQEMSFFHLHHFLLHRPQHHEVRK